MNALTGTVWRSAKTRRNSRSESAIYRSRIPRQSFETIDLGEDLDFQSRCRRAAERRYVIAAEMGYPRLKTAGDTSITALLAAAIFSRSTRSMKTPISRRARYCVVSTVNPKVEIRSIPM